MKTLHDCIPAASRRDRGEGWFYIRVRGNNLARIEAILKKSFETYHHKSIELVVKDERKLDRTYSTLGNVIFVHGKSEDIAEFLTANFPDLQLFIDCATKLPAFISDEEMDQFIKISNSGHPIRFMFNNEAYYWLGNDLVRVISGPLKGMEGFIIRLNRDKNLLLRIGDKVVAFGAIQKSSLENIDEYERLSGDILKDYTVSTIIETTADIIPKSVYAPNSLMNLVLMSEEIRNIIARIRIMLVSGHIEPAQKIGKMMIEIIVEHMKLFMPTITSKYIRRCYEKDMKKLARDTYCEFKKYDEHSARYGSESLLKELSSIFNRSTYLCNCSLNF